MTKSTITRERLEQLANFKGAPVTRQEEQELASIALAAMDSEPDCKERKLFCSTDTTRMRKTISVSAGTEDAPLYRHAQQPVVSADLLHTAASAIEDLLTTKDRTGAGVWFDLPFRLRSAANAQPAPVVPDGYVMVPEEPTESMVIAGFESEPDEFFSESEVWEAYQKMSGCEQAAFRARLCWRAMLAAAPQEDVNALIPLVSRNGQGGDRWIPVSEQKPDCWCRTCRPVDLNDMRFVVCPDCGNKRCPRANDHRNACTGSNEPGQEGCAYPDTTLEPKP
ncbi:hypothetical protein [Klebsiella pneumoniae]|uniref:hypothetical protein n=1 Tax=Klebsiella pneumoniae TaxID=573 RepID=UPI003F576988